MDELQAVEEARKLVARADDCAYSDDEDVSIEFGVLKALLARAMRPHD